MSISSAQTSSPATTREPLESLLETIRRAQQLTEAGSFEPRSNTSGQFQDGGDDPLAGLRHTIAAEASYQSRSAPTQWPAADKWPAADQWPAADASDQDPTPQPDIGGASAADGAALAPAGPATDTEARVGRELLAMLRERPLSGAARASAVERLAAQIQAPDANALREVLAILVTGETD